MVGAVHDFRGTYNVTDYRWFNLRDHDSASANFQHHYGLLRDDYSAKPGFAEFKALIARLARREPAAAAAPALRLRAYCSRRRARVTLVGAGLAGVRSAVLRAQSRSATDRSRPFTRRFAVSQPRPLVSVTARLKAGGTVRLARRLTCA